MVDFGRRSGRSGRAAARRATATIERTPKSFDPIEDEPMADAEDKNEADDDDHKEDGGTEDEQREEENNSDGVATTDNESSKANAKIDADGTESAGADTDALAAASSAAPLASESPSPAPVMMIRRKRLGRPPKNRPPDWDGMVEVPMSESEIAAAQAAAAAAKDGTPRRRGRGGWRGRGGRKGDMGPSQPLQQSIDKDGKLVDIVNDELDLPEDPVGETKVDKNGNLQDGREYRCRTFTVAGRGSRLYMLSTEPARCVGFRDSYLFFTKHRRLYKVLVGDEEKRDMIEREIIPHSYKGRTIGIVTARSVFREFGALIIVGGRRVIDDYTLANEEEGAPPVVEGALADPNDRFVPGQPYNKNQYVAWHGASAVYHSASGPAMGSSTPGGGQGGAHAASAAQNPYKAADARKRRVAVNDRNWQLEHAREASNFNSILTAARQTTLAGVYDIHTNVMQYPASMQPQRARAVLVEDETAEADQSATFPPLPLQVARNWYVADLHLTTPPAGIAPAAYDRYRINGAGSSFESPKNDALASFQGLGAVSDDIRSLLPEECRAAFDAARDREQQWFGQWGAEEDAMCRREPIIDKAIVPYAMML